MTPQEIFDASFTKIVAQKNPSSDKFGGCYYTHPENPEIHCAVGVLMNKKELEAYGDFPGTFADVIDHEKRDKNDTLRPFFKKNQGLLCEIQRAHDLATRAGRVNGKDFVRKFVAHMNVVAKQHGFTVPEIAKDK